MAEKSNPPQATKTQSRKNNKPQMEKRRRAKINHFLGQLSTLLSEWRKKDCTRHSKLEKADILEMTVRYVKELQNKHSMEMRNADSEMHSRYRTGYVECAKEITRYLSSSQNVDVSVRNRINNHLARSISMIDNTQQDVKPVPHLESPEYNSPDNAVRKTEPMEQELPAPVASPISSPAIIPTRTPPAALQINIPNSMPFSGISVPVLASSNETSLSSKTHCHNTIPTDYSNRIDSLRTQVTLMATPHRDAQDSVPMKTSPNLDKSSSPVTDSLLVKLPPTHVTGSFQIVPGSICNGQPMAVYLAPTSALSTVPVTSTSHSSMLSMQVPQVVTAVVPQPTLGGDIFSHQTSAISANLLRAVSAHSLPVSYPHRIDTGSFAPIFHSNPAEPIQGDPCLWRPW